MVSLLSLITCSRAEEMFVENIEVLVADCDEKSTFNYYFLR